MAIKQILFNTEMVQAILEGRKTQTRRIAFKHDDLREFKSSAYPEGWWYEGRVYKSFNSFFRDRQGPRCRYAPGDILWVRETWSRVSDWTTVDHEVGIPDGYIYRADWEDGEEHPRWRPSIHMPKEAARIFLRVKDVRVERLQDITEGDVISEGAEPLIQCPREHRTYEPDGSSGDMCWNTNCCTPCYFLDKSYGELFGEMVWDNLLEKADFPHYNWDANPWVWVIEFERCEKPEGWC